MTNNEWKWDDGSKATATQKIKKDEEIILYGFQSEIKLLWLPGRAAHRLNGINAYCNAKNQTAQ